MCNFHNMWLSKPKNQIMFDTGQLSCQFPVNLKKEGATFLVGGIQESQDGNFYRFVIIYHILFYGILHCMSISKH